MTAVGIAALSLLFVFLAWIFYLALTSPRAPPPEPVPATTGATVTAGRVFLPCSPGQCALNLFNGVKRCPEQYGSILADAAVEVCAGEFVCDSAFAPFAVQEDGSTTYSGICPPGSPCPCSRSVRCPEYIVAGFRLQEETQKRRSYFTQFTQIQGPPSSIEISNPSQEFCSAPFSWLAVSSPGCPGAANGDSQSIIQCMGMPLACSGATVSTCSQGTLALLPDKPLYQLTESDLFTSQYGCVRGQPCPCGLLAVWDRQSGSVVCSKLPGT